MNRRAPVPASIVTSAVALCITDIGGVWISWWPRRSDETVPVCQV